MKMDIKICVHFNYGFCRFSNNCRYQHIKEICTSTSCDTSSCSLRHPKECWYWKTFGQCKFGSFCFYSHSEIKMEKVGKEIETVKKEIEHLKSIIHNLQHKLECFQASVNSCSIQETTTSANLSNDFIPQIDGMIHRR